MISAHYLSKFGRIAEVIEVGYLARAVMHKFLIWQDCSWSVSEGLLARIWPLQFLSHEFLILLVAWIYF